MGASKSRDDKKLSVSEAIVFSRLMTPDQLAEVGYGPETSEGDEEFLSRLVAGGHLTPWHARQLLLGKTKGFYLGQYKLLLPLGMGGTGQVFKAHDTSHDRFVAIKVLSQGAKITDAVERFRREATASFQLQHPSIVHTYALDKAGPIHFMVMEYVDGIDLNRYVKKHGRLSVQQAAQIGQQVAEALSHASERGITHRDIKPSNIMITSAGKAKVTDLGLVKFFGQETEDPVGITKTGFFMGSIDYCAPEQAEDPRQADASSDLYSLGCSLYYCLTGRSPFNEGTEIQRIMAHRNKEPERIDDLNPMVPEHFANLIHHDLMSKHPKDRFPTPGDAASAFELWLPGQVQQDLFSTLLQEFDVEPQDALPTSDGALQVQYVNLSRSSSSIFVRINHRILRLVQAKVLLPMWAMVLGIVFIFLLGMAVGVVGDFKD